MRRMNRRIVAWIVLCAVVVAVGGFFRLAALDRKAVHHDESVNFAFTKRLLEKGKYAYNPTAYHGPFLYFAGLPAVAIAGFSKTTLRLTPTLFGLLAVIMLLLMHPQLGKPGALLAAAILALSPADVYFSRTFIHEIYFVFATLGMFWVLLVGARNGKPLPIVAFWIFLTLTFTIKETAAFGVIAFGAAMIVAWLSRYLTNEPEPLKPEYMLGFHNFNYLLWAIGLSLTVWTLLFTSFLSNPNGIPDFFRAYLSWFDTGVKSKPHAKSWTYFFIMVGKYYLPAIPFVLWAMVRGIWKRRTQTLFLLTVALVTQVIYSAIPYKTPWCVLVIGLCWVVLAADGFTDLWKTLRYPALQITVAVLVGIGLVVYGVASYRLNFERYDDDEGYKIVYVQTLRDYEKMPADLQRFVDASDEDEDIPIYITKGAKNPGRFYLRNYPGKKQQYHDLPDVVDFPIIVTRSNEYDELNKHLIHSYRSETYPVFPGWWIYLLVEEELWQRVHPEETTQ